MSDEEFLARLCLMVAATGWEVRCITELFRAYKNETIAEVDSVQAWIAALEAGEVDHA